LLAKTGGGWWQVIAMEKTSDGNLLNICPDFKSLAMESEEINCGIENCHLNIQWKRQDVIDMMEKK
jgi:hypothetical protein